MGAASSKPASSLNSSFKKGPASRPTPEGLEEGRPVYILVEKGSVIWNTWSEDLKPPQAVRDFIDRLLPECFRHWALRVGDDLWELGAQGDVIVLSEDRLWSQENQTRDFDEYFVGMTTETTTQIDRKGECRMRKRAHCYIADA
jgi:hypothetical protein